MNGVSLPPHRLHPRRLLHPNDRRRTARPGRLPVPIARPAATARLRRAPGRLMSVQSVPTFARNRSFRLCGVAAATILPAEN